jgi:hypothetical protein
LVEVTKILDDKIVEKTDLNIDKAVVAFNAWHSVAESLRAITPTEESKTAIDKFTKDLTTLVLGGVKEKADEVVKKITEQTSSALDASTYDSPVWDRTECERLKRLASVLEAPDHYLRVAELASAFLLLGKSALQYLDSKDNAVFSSRLNKDTKLVLSHLVAAKAAHATLLKGDTAVSAMSSILGTQDEATLTLGVTALDRLGFVTAGFESQLELLCPFLFFVFQMSIL